MSDKIEERCGKLMLVCSTDGIKIRTLADADNLIGHAFLGVELVALPVERLDDSFFSLQTRLAGHIMQKFATYRLQLAIIGDISRYLANSPSLQALVQESNAGRHIWFLPNMTPLDERLQAIG